MEETLSLTELLENTSAMARDLEALRNEHHSLLTGYQVTDTIDYGESGEGERPDEGTGWDPELEEALKREKEELVNESMKKLEAGVSEAKLMLMLANYVNSLESDNQKLKAQVKRLCSENNWLRQELTTHQQLLQESEVSLCKVREEKEQLEFLLSQERRDKRERGQSPAMDIDVREEEKGILRESGDRDGIDGQAAPKGGQEPFEYEVPEKIKTLHHLALQYVNQGKHDVAIPLCKKAVQELELKKGRDNPDLAAMLNVLAVIYREQGKLKEATKVLQETLDIREKVFGLHHPAVASTLNNLSVLHGKCGDFKTAEPYCRKALEIRQKLLGANHPDVAKQFTNLAILCTHLGKYDEVEYYYQRALEIYQAELGADDPNVTKTMTNLANCYLKQGKYQAAESIFKKVLTTVQKGEGSQSTSQDASSWVLNSSPRSPTSSRGREESYSDKGGWHKLNPPQSPTVSSTLKNLSAVYREQGRLDAANELDRLTERRTLDQSQRERMNKLLAEPTVSPLPSLSTSQVGSSSPSSAASHQQKPRGSLSLNVRRLFGIKGTESAEQDSTTQT